MRSRLVLLLVALLPLFSGCNKQDLNYFTGFEAGVIDAGRFTSDNGISMKIEQNQERFDIQTPRRVLLSYETTSFEEHAGISVAPLDILDAVVTPPVPETDIPEAAEDTPTTISNAWFSGGYMNILASVEASDAALHTFSLAFAVNANETVLRLRHDSSNDSSTAKKARNVFLSFPMNDVVQAFDLFRISLGMEILSPVPVLFQWTGYEQKDGPAVLIQKEGSFTPNP